MTWASVIHGAHGLQWYTYRYDKKNHGFSWSEETRRNFTRIVKETAPLTDIIMSETLPGLVPAILRGPKTDALGNPSVSVLAKLRGKEIWLFAVNSSCEEIRVLFPVRSAEEAEVLYENGRKAVTDSIGVVDDFGPLDVHIYRIRRKP